MMLTAYELAIRENIPPPGYNVGGGHGFGWFWEAGSGCSDARLAGFRSRRDACLSAWGHYDQHQHEVK